MPKQALAALDWPNLEVFLERHAQTVNFGYLRDALELDAARRLDVSPAAMSFEARVFSYEDKALTSQLREEMSGAGWEVFAKPRQERTAKLIAETAAYMRLYEFFHQPSHMRSLDLRDADPSLVEDRQLIYEQALLILRVYADSGLLERRHIRSIRSRTHGGLALRDEHEAARLLETCRDVNELLLSYEWLARRSEFESIVTSLKATSRYRKHVQIDDVKTMPDEELALMIRGLMHRVQRVYRRTHHLADIDLDLTDWVNQHFLHDDPLEGEAVVYLIGGDFRNHLPAAERLKDRYGVEPILVMMREQYANTRPATRRALDAYQQFWLDGFVSSCAPVAS